MWEEKQVVFFVLLWAFCAGFWRIAPVPTARLESMEYPRMSEDVVKVGECLNATLGQVGGYCGKNVCEWIRLQFRVGKVENEV